MSKNADPDIERVIKAARAVRAHAHAPYSKFKVGAAILSTEDGLFVGANVENASFPEGICAEGGAISAMIAAGHKSIRLVAVTADPAVTPCGGCRQKLAEFSKAQTQVVLVNAQGGDVRIVTVGELLPYAFKFDA